MRSLVPMPDNPWPHDMVITIEDGPVGLLLATRSEAEGFGGCGAAARVSTRLH